MTSLVKSFWPRAIHYKCCSSDRQYYMVIDSLDKFISVLQSQCIGEVNFETSEIKNEMELILSENDYIDKPLLLSTEVDDHGGLFIMMPVKTYSMNTIVSLISPQSKEISLWYRLDKKYEQGTSHDLYNELDGKGQCKVISAIKKTTSSKKKTIAKNRAIEKLSRYEIECDQTMQSAWSSTHHTFTNIKISILLDIPEVYAEKLINLIANAGDIEICSLDGGDPEFPISEISVTKLAKSTASQPSINFKLAPLPKKDEEIHRKDTDLLSSMFIYLFRSFTIACLEFITYADKNTIVLEGPSQKKTRTQT